MLRPTAESPTSTFKRKRRPFDVIYVCMYSYITAKARQGRDTNVSLQNEPMLNVSTTTYISVLLQPRKRCRIVDGCRSTMGMMYEWPRSGDEARDDEFG